MAARSTRERDQPTIRGAMSPAWPSTPSLGSALLVLIPTELERRRLLDHGELPPGISELRLCGFGPVAAAARAAQLLAELRPRRVLLLGIAGSYDARALPIGSAHEFRAVALDGVGAGEGDDFAGPPALGFPQWPGSSALGGGAIEDRLDLAAVEPARAAPLLVSTCAAASDARMAARRRARFAGAAAEDMEGFGVALACALAGVPLSIVRGISNEVGDRDPAHWKISSALGAARARLLELADAL